MINDHVSRTTPPPRQQGEELLHALAGQFPADAGVVEGRMFNGQGLRLGSKFFAFVSHTGDLVIKVSRAEVAWLIDEHQAEPMTMRSRTMREWVRIPYPIDGDHDRWQPMLQRAWAYAAGQTGSAG